MDIDIIPAEQEHRLTFRRNDKGNIIWAYSAEPLINWLLDERLIEEWHHYAAVEFYQRQWRHERKSLPKSVNLDRIGGQAEEAANIYTNIIRRIPAHQLNLIHEIGEREATADAKHGSRVMRIAIVDALEALAKATEDAINACDAMENVVKMQTA